MSTSEDLLVVAADEAAAVLDGEDATLMELVAAAYALHGRGASVVPHSSFLRLPGGQNRVIALPAYLGGARPVAGLKWIASFPENVTRGLERASGLVVVNSLETGRPCAVVEGALVSAKRTAASAAIAARALHVGAPPTCVGLVGCGTINFETLRFLRAVWPGIERVVLYDVDGARAAAFVQRWGASDWPVRCDVAPDWRTVLAECALVAIATTAMTPYVDALPAGPLRTLLHLSLRDLAPAVVLGADNVVDDVDHVCRAETSLHLAERATHGRAFIRCTLAEVLAGIAVPKWVDDSCTTFSPFGLGILDIAVARYVCERAEARGKGTRLPFASRATRTRNATEGGCPAMPRGRR